MRQLAGKLRFVNFRSLIRSACPADSRIVGTSKRFIPLLFRPDGQRCAAFSGSGILLEFLEFSALFGGYFCHVGVVKGGFRTVTSSFVGAVVVAFLNGPRHSLQQIIIGFGKFLPFTQTLSQCPHRIRKAPILRTIASIHILSCRHFILLRFVPPRFDSLKIFHSVALQGLKNRRMNFFKVPTIRKFACS